MKHNYLKKVKATIIAFTLSINGFLNAQNLNEHHQLLADELQESVTNPSVNSGNINGTMIKSKVVGLRSPALVCDSLPTTFAGGNGHDGNMFDLTAIDTITISDFEGNIDGNGYIKIYYKAGAYQGSQTTPGNWTLIDSANVTSNGIGLPTLIPISVNITIPASQTYAFYITGTASGAAVDYTNGTTEGAIFSSDSKLQFKEGLGLAYPFGSSFTPRVWNGNINYCYNDFSTSLSTVFPQPKNKIEVFPNPFNDFSTIRTGSTVNNGELKLYNFFGKEVKQIVNIKEQEIKIERGNLPAGVYFYQLSDNDVIVGTGKIVINE